MHPSSSQAAGGQTPRAPWDHLIFSVWFALVASLGGIVPRLWQHARGTRLMGLQELWLVPVGNAVLFLAVGSAFALGARFWPRRASLAVLVLTCGFVCSAEWLSHLRGLHQVSALLLAVGLSVQLSVSVAQHVARARRVVWITTSWLAIVVTVPAAVASAWPVWRAHRLAERQPPISRPASNVLLVVLDTVRRADLGLYGSHRQTTPRLDRFAGRGVVFDRAFSTAPWTLPSHGSMFTGRFPHEIGGGWTSPLDAAHPTLAEALRRHGYATAGFVANTSFGGAEYGLGRGFAVYDDHTTSLGTALVRTWMGRKVSGLLSLPDYINEYREFDAKSAGRVNDEFLRWLSSHDRTRPFFAFLNYFDAHSPYVSSEAFARRFGAPRRLDVWSKALDAWSEPDISRLHDAYAAAVSDLDDELGNLFAELDQRGILGDTLVIVTADHGEQFGEHGLMEHANSLYLPLVHVPLIIVYPSRVRPGRRVDAVVSLRDLPVTVLDLIGLPAAADFPGTPLPLEEAPGGEPASDGGVALIETDKAPGDQPSHYPARLGKMKSVVFGDRQYIRNEGNGREELYDIRRDPEQLHDLSVAEPQSLQEYRAVLKRLLGAGTR